MIKIKILIFRKLINLMFQNFVSILESNFIYLSQILARDRDVRFLYKDGVRIFCTKEVPSDFARSINSFLDQSFSDKSTLLKSTKSRAVATSEFPQHGSKEKRIFIKRYMVTNRLKGIINLITPSKAWREMYITNKLLKSGIPTAKPLLVAEKRSNSRLKESYLITEGIPNTKTFLSFIQSETSQKKKRELLGKLTNFISRLHNEGFYHADLSLRNILVSETKGNDLELFVMDIDKGILSKKVSSWSRAKNLFQILRLMNQKLYFTEDDRNFLIENYSENSNFLPPDKLWKQIKRVDLYSTIKKNYRKIKRGEI
ncbi:MAG: hypothetical protein A2149_08275 [Candidatus Schekmanbacteria bacterium RBG_16_38_11]|uniref:Protein kinase domain-containing protein n=1 Tax=Candidatus Schekmanbacteria bacterium RBG_16_38_11 TaxID=1817880 RepID=A0A1F7RUU9_9BACT|nr:MAG: hypothetical protein A2149_08275 [Candidatus Schekmanbacteria bacterium RBG_16_38_11]